jgi:hypothetical protein
MTLEAPEVTLVQVVHRFDWQIQFARDDLAGLKRPSKWARHDDLGFEQLSESSRHFVSLAHAKLGQSNLRGSGEAAFAIPFALAVTHHNKLAGVGSIEAAAFLVLNHNTGSITSSPAALLSIARASEPGSDTHWLVRLSASGYSAATIPAISIQPMLRTQRANRA